MAEDNKADSSEPKSPIEPELLAAEIVVPTLALAPPSPEPAGWLQKTLKIFGPGLVTGAADDDPSGIATYSSIGAQFGYAMLWTMPLIYPFMGTMQEISARLGRVTGRGIAGNMRHFYPAWMLYIIVFLLLVANIINIGADIGAMGAAVSLLAGGPTLVFCAVFALVSVLLEVFVPYKKYSAILKWLTLSLFAYVGTVFVVQIDWKDALQGTFIPNISLKSDYLAALIAVLGTTISPYLPAYLKVLGWLATAIMALAAAGLLLTSGH
jgi:NRAMP (natural resistance-associated macrophage protein)-like metal ion transporter